MIGKSTFGDGIPSLSWKLLWLLGGVVAIVSIGADLLAPNIDRMIGRDFTNLWVAGKLVWAGTPECAYDVNCFRIAIFRNLNMLSLQNYSYPPTALFVAAPFALLPYYVALAAWTAVGIAFFVWSARPFLPKRFPPALAALTPAATINIWNGHYGFLVGGLWLLCFRELDRQPARSGALAGLLTIKPHLGVMVAATVVRNRRALIAAAMTTVVLIAVSGIAFGTEVWNGFLFNTTAEQKRILTSTSSEFYFMMMPSAYVAFGRGVPGLIAQLITATAAIVLLARRRNWDAFSAATATFLIVPYVFNYDMTVACLGFAILLFLRWTQFTVFEKGALVIAFLSPEMTYLLPMLVPPALIAALYIQLRYSRGWIPIDGRRFDRGSLDRLSTSDQEGREYHEPDDCAVVSRLDV